LLQEVAWWIPWNGSAGTRPGDGETVPLKAGTLLLIERGDTHEIRNKGERPLRTLNVYVPPAYTEDGEELPRGRK
jgi:mannose-6-phosphate isomerase-like protein (cupin superfamily)